MVKTSPFNAGGMGLTPVQGSKIPHALQPYLFCNKFKDIVTNSKKTFKMARIKKYILKE